MTRREQRERLLVLWSDLQARAREPGDRDLGPLILQIDPSEEIVGRHALRSLGDHRLQTVRRLGIVSIALHIHRRQLDEGLRIPWERLERLLEELRGVSMIVSSAEQTSPGDPRASGRAGLINSLSEDVVGVSRVIIGDEGEGEPQLGLWAAKRAVLVLVGERVQDDASLVSAPARVERGSKEDPELTGDRRR